MNDQSQAQESGKVIYWLLAVFVIVVMVGLAVFYYVSGQDNQAETDTTQSEAVATSEDDATIDSSLDDLDQDLQAIEDEINSTEDDTSDI
ncbi:MAG: hypothetical protein WEC83_00015 [Patescibacteria group bacterium]